MRRLLSLLLLLFAVPAVAETISSMGVLQADAVLNRSGQNRRTGGVQLVDATTTGSIAVPPSASATGASCALDTTKLATKASWSSANTSQFGGCVFDGTWDLTGSTYLWLDVGFDTSAYATSFWPLISSDATLSTYANYGTWTDLWITAMKPVRGWLPIKIADMVNHGTPNMAAIKHIEIRFIKKTANTAIPYNAYFYGIWKDLTARPKILITHDDGFAGYYQYIYPYLVANGMVGTLYPNGSKIGTTNYMTIAQVKEIAAAGFTIGSHGWAHTNYALGPTLTYTRSGATATIVTPFAHGLSNGNSVTIAGCDETGYNGTFTVTVSDTTTFTFTLSTQAADTTARGWCYISAGVAPNVYKADIRRNLEWLQTNGFPFGGSHFAFANGAYDPDVVTALGSSGFGYVTARTILSTLMGGIVPTFYTFTGLPSSVALTLPSYAIDSSSSSHTPADILSRVDSTIATGGNLILYGHNINATNGSSTLCTAAATPYPCCTGNGTGTNCATSTEQYLGDFRAVIDGLKTRCVTAHTCDVVTVSDFFNHL